MGILRGIGVESDVASRVGVQSDQQTAGEGV